MNPRMASSFMTDIVKRMAVLKESITEIKISHMARYGYSGCHFLLILARLSRP
jgi:hypothetical protein